MRQPGRKFDEMIVLESEQGKNNSSALALKAVRPDWFTDDLPLNRDIKEVIERTGGRWIVNPYFVWRYSLGHVAKVEGKHRKFSRRNYYGLVANFMAKNGYQRRGVIHELVADRVRTGLAARDL